MTTRRQFVALAGAAVLLPRGAAAQAPRKVIRIGYLTDAHDFPAGARDILEKGLRELGYLEGKSFVWETRFAKARIEQVPSLAAELVALNVDIIVAGGSQATRAAKDTTSKIPVVMITSGDPVARGLVPSLAHPGGNVTGVTSNLSHPVAKRLDILCELAPKSRRVGYLTFPGTLGGQEIFEAAADLARRERNVELVQFPASSPMEIEIAFKRMKQSNVDSSLVGTALPFIAQEKKIADLARALRLPSVASFRSYATAGGLATYADDYVHLYYRAATYIDKIAKGARPGDLPVGQHDKYELWLNQRTAKLLGITIPERLLLRASNVIQ